MALSLARTHCIMMCGLWPSKRERGHLSTTRSHHQDYSIFPSLLHHLLVSSPSCKVEKKDPYSE